LPFGSATVQGSGKEENLHRTACKASASYSLLVVATLTSQLGT
jgi:hypothetical protein